MSQPSMGDIIERHRMLGWPVTEGEWDDISQHIRVYYREALERGDAHTLKLMFANLFQAPLTYGLIGFTIDQWATEKGRQDLSRDVSLAHRTLRVLAAQEDNTPLEAPRHGTPALFLLESGTATMYDQPRHDYAAVRVLEALGSAPNVLEIGGGYGGLAHQLLTRDAAARIVLCDLAPTLYIAWWWLAGSGWDVAWWDEDRDASVVLLPHDRIGAWDQVPDMVVNAHSWGEMPASAVAAYLDWCRERGVRYIYHENAAVRLAKPRADYTAHLFPEVLAHEFPMDGYRQVWRAPALWPNTCARYCEYLYERTG